MEENAIFCAKCLVKLPIEKLTKDFYDNLMCLHCLFDWYKVKNIYKFKPCRLCLSKEICYNMKIEGWYRKFIRGR